jgi:proteasome lid subunit RPN8/RPN11
MSESKFLPDGAANWRAPGRKPESFPMTDQEIYNAIQILDILHTQVPTKKDSPRTFYQTRVPGPVVHPAFSGLETGHPPFDIFLSQHVENEMAAHLDSVAPIEGIGLLLGRVGVEMVNDTNRTYVELKHTVPMRLIDQPEATTTNATITASGWLRAEGILQNLRERYPEIYEDVHIIGWYHQHPIGTNLSEMDMVVHNGAFTEPHQVTFVRNATPGALGVFYRPVEVTGGRELIPVGHFRQTDSYWYEGTKPIAYALLEDEYTTRHAGVEVLSENSAWEEEFIQARTPWFTKEEIARELQEMKNVAAIVAFEEAVADETIIITAEELTAEAPVVELYPAGDSVPVLLGEFEEFIDYVTSYPQPEEDFVIEVTPETSFQFLVRKFRNTIGNSLIRLGKKIQQDQNEPGE